MMRVNDDKDCEQVFIVTESKCIWQPGEHEIWKSESTSELVECAANKYAETRLGASSSNSSEWNNDDKWSSQMRRTSVRPI